MTVAGVSDQWSVISDQGAFYYCHTFSINHSVDSFSGERA